VQWRTCSIRAVLSLVMLAAVTHAQARSVTEYQIKAAFLYNFSKFIEWPADARPAPGLPIRICILGVNPFGPEMERTIAGKRVDGHPIEAVDLRTLAQARTCQILFLALAESSKLRQALNATAGHGVLVVGEHRGLAEQGAAINFVVDEDRVRFDINARAASSAHLKISSKLLALARKVVG
jgi:hypothetical protein